MVSCSQKKEKTDSLNDSLKEMSISAGNYTADIDSSELTWIGRKISSGHNGTINLKDGALNISKDGSIYGKFTIDMNSISVSDLQGGGKKALKGT